MPRLPESNTEYTPRPPRRKPLHTVLWCVVGLIAVLVLAWAWKGAEMNPGLLVEERQSMAEFVTEFWPPDPANWQLYLEEMIVTVQMAIWGTLLAVVAAIPFGLLSSANITPFGLRQPVRRLMDAFRAINEIVLALLFIAAVGLGPFPGVLALFVHTTGILAKLFSEAVEAIDPGPVEGIRATGARPLDEITYAVIPQVMPLWVSYSLYRFESNVRSATVLGIVGAGGIGMLLQDQIRSFNFPAVTTILLIIVAAVVLLDLASAQLRKVFI